MQQHRGETQTKVIFFFLTENTLEEQLKQCNSPVVTGVNSVQLPPDVLQVLKIILDILVF